MTSVKKENQNQNTMTNIYLDVPYEQKDEVKNLGALWDRIKRRWYINDYNQNKEVILEKWGETPVPTSLDGEDVDLHENYQLAPDIRPISIHGKGITKDNMPSRDFEMIKRFSFERDGGKCKCCKTTRAWKVDELLEYDTGRKIAKVRSIISICRLCWLSRHLGSAQCQGLYQNAIDNLKSVRNIDDEQLNELLQNHRNGEGSVNIRDQWSLDASLLTNNGFTLYSST
jgi:hypothetical protein